MRFPASARLPCCVHAPAAIFRAPRPSKPLPAPSRRIPARAYDLSPRLRLSPLPCLNLLAAAAAARMPRQNHDAMRHAHPQPHFLPAFSLLLALPVAIRRCCAPPCTQHRGSQSSQAPQPEVRGDHPRCSHTQCRHAPQAWGAKHLHTLTAHLPPSQSRRIGMYPLSPCFVSASDQQRAAPAQSSCTHTIRRKAVDHVYSPAVLTRTKLVF